MKGHAGDKKLEAEARGRECQVRLPGVCNFNPETTVLAHARLAGLCGTGIKPYSLLGAHACSACHDEIDRRSRNLETDFVRLAFYEGVLRTQYALIQEGKVRW